MYVRTTYADQPLFQRLLTVFTVHNLAYQGLFGSDTLAALDLGQDLYSVDGLDFFEPGELSEGRHRL